MDKKRPEKIGKYQVEGVLGSGAMGVVYKAYDPFIKRTVAIKTIHQSLLNTDLSDEVLARFEKEAEAVGRLTHPNIVSIFDFDQFNGLPYFVMEFVEGRELKTLMRNRQPMPLEQAIPLVVSVLEGLAYTHRLGIIHRDIKPANIFVLEGGQVKIADFGVARLDNSEYTQVGRVLGTPSYMSPEQCQGALLDARSDLFSVAVMLYEMLTGQKAFTGGDAQETMRKVVNEPYHALPSFCRDLWPPQLEHCLAKALAKQPERRFQSAEAFKQALLPLLPVGPASSNRQQHPWRKGSMAALGLAGAVSLLAMVLFYVGVDISGDAVKSEKPERSERSEKQASRPSDLGAVSVPEASVTAHPKRVLTLAEHEKVSRLLKVAKAHLLVQRLVMPQGSNAYDAYQLVLQMDPGNRDALSGLLVVEEQLVRRVQALKSEGKTADARAYFELGQKLFRNGERWKQPF